MTDKPDLFKARESRPPKRKFNLFTPDSEYCTFEEFKNSESWRMLNVTSAEEKILESMIIEGVLTL